MTTSVQPMCLPCQHLNRQEIEARTCTAFTDGIPDDIWMNRRAHFDAYPGDDNIQFELVIVTADMIPRNLSN